MATLKKFNQTPPGGWQYLQPETKFVIKAENGDVLIDLVVQHRIYKGLVPTERNLVRLDIERQICTRLGHHECKPEGKDDKWVARDGSKPMLGMSQMLAFSKAAIAFIASGAELAPMEEVRRRAPGCLNCPLNIPVSGCSCGVFYKAIAAAVPKSRQIDGLNLCSACGCSLQAKINLTDEQIRVSNEGRKIEWPGGGECFQREIMLRSTAV